MNHVYYTTRLGFLYLAISLIKNLKFMKKLKRGFIFLLFIFNYVFGNFVLDESRKVNWSNAGVYGGIPHISSPIVNVKDFGATGNGSTDDSPAVQAAIDSVKNKLPAIVYFPEGNYLLKNKINLQNLDGIVIRGAGYRKTKLIFDLNGRNDNCIEVLTYRRGSWVNAVSGYQKGSNQIVVADVSQFKVGDIAEIQQANDPAVMYTNPQWQQSWAENSVGQFFRIVGINGNTLIIDPPLNITFRAELNPQVRRNNLISNVGFEDFYIERVDSGDGNTFYFKNAANCWIRRVESYNTVKAHVSATSCLNLEIRECYFHHSHRYDAGGHGYGVELGFHVTNCLIENNIFKHLRHSMMVHLGANGNVFGYNYSIEPYQDQNPGVWTPCDISVHGHYPFMNLFEGNIVQEIDCTDYWGPAGPGNTFFRNRIEEEGIELMDKSHNQNVIGNELIKSTISVQSDINGTLLHGNNIQGVIVWAENLSKDLPPSLYKTSKPVFFKDLPWPSIGPNNTINSATIPAKLRYEQQDYIPYDDTVSTPIVRVNLIVNPQGSGYVSILPSSDFYIQGATVSLTAEANFGWKFKNWSGDITGNQNPIVITLDTDKLIIANFEKIISTFTQKIAIPAYFYPEENSTYWQQLINSAGPVGLVVVNPSDGPGNSKDLNYERIINNLRSAGIKVIGYVYSSYGNRNVSEVKSDIDKFFQWYTIDGIFVDEADNSSSKVGYYSEIYNYIKQTYGNDKLVVLNPGTNTIEEYMNVSDIIITFEDDYQNYLSWTPSGWENKYSPERFWHLIINTSSANLKTAIDLSKERKIGWIYVTDDNLPNPWDTLPKEEYWNQLINSVSSSSVMSCFLTVRIIPSNEAGRVEVYPQVLNNEYVLGSTVTISAIPNYGYIFSNWGGDVTGSSTTVTLLMDSDKLVVAYFVSISTSTDLPPQKETTTKYLKDNYLLTINNDNRNDVFEIDDEIELLEIYDLRGGLVHKTTQKINSLTFLKIGSYVYKIKFKNGKTKFGSLIVIK